MDKKSELALAETIGLSNRPSGAVLPETAFFLQCMYVPITEYGSSGNREEKRTAMVGDWWPAESMAWVA